MFEVFQTEVYAKWERNLSDSIARAAITARLARLAAGLPGDTQSVGDGVSELRVHYGPGYRVYFHKRGTRIIVLLCGGDKGSQRRDIAKAKELARTWELWDMSEKLIPYDPAEGLTTPEAVEYFVNDALDSADAAYIAHAIGIAARAKGMTRIADETGLAREALYRSFSEDGNPSLKSTIAVLKSLGFVLSIKPLPDAVSGNDDTAEAAE
jgi:putative addiction module killer protein/probable addiction module antidote protein